jgi:WD40 repeat protein
MSQYSVDSWSPPCAYGEIPGDAVLDQSEDRGKRSRSINGVDTIGLWSSSSLLSRTALPFPAADQPQRVAFAELFRMDRRNRCTVTSKSPPPIAAFMLDAGVPHSAIDVATININATLFACAAGGTTVIWSPPNQSQKLDPNESLRSQNYQSLFNSQGGQRFGLSTGSGTTCLDFAPDSNLILSGTSRGELSLWSFEAQRKLVSYTGIASRTAVWSLCWSPASSYFSTGSSDGCVRVWRSDVPYPIRVLSPGDTVRHCRIVKWHPSCQLIGVASDEFISVHDISASTKTHQLDFKGATALEFSPTGALLAAANRDRLCVWDLSANAEIFSCDTFSSITDLAWTYPSAGLLGDGGLRSANQQAGIGHPVLISVEESGKVRLWDRLLVSKPSSCEFQIEQSMRTLHMHVTPRNLLVIAGSNDTSDFSTTTALRSLT